MAEGLRSEDETRKVYESLLEEQRDLDNLRFWVRQDVDSKYPHANTVGREGLLRREVHLSFDAIGLGRQIALVEWVLGMNDKFNGVLDARQEVELREEDK